MLSPVQQWLASPTNARWEQPSFAALRDLCMASAPLRKKQAVQLWDAKVLNMAMQITPLAWASMYAKIAKALVYTPTIKALLNETNNVENRWLIAVASFPSYVSKDKDRYHAGKAIRPLLNELGHEHPLARAFVETAWLDSEQIQYWRETFPQDPMHDKMQMAIDVQMIRQQSLNGYLRARKSLLVPKVYDPIDLSILGDDL